MSCTKCGDPAIVFKSALGAYFLVLGEETAQITYCPECGTLLDVEGARRGDVPIRDALDGLSGRARAVVSRINYYRRSGSDRREQIKTIGDLARFTETELYQMSGVGVKIVKELSARLDEYGLRFKR